VGRDERFFSYLPLAHVAERLVIETTCLYGGGSVAFAESLETFADNMRDIQPTVFVAVPRIWRKFQEKVFEQVTEARLDRLLRIPIVSTVTRRKIKNALGLSHCRIAVTGAAPVPVAMLEWYRKLGITILEAYGLTENFGYSHMVRPDDVRFGSAGRPWPGVETKVGSNGELLVKDPCTMQGYFKDPELTAEALQGGYLYTGDLGRVDAEGNLFIVGRVKELFKTAKGKYVAPAPIELRFSACELLEHTCVTGPGLPQPFALATLSNAAKVLSLANVSSQLEAVLADVNASLEPHERLAKIVIVPDTWSIEAGLMTPTLKLRRAILERKYEPWFESWFGASGVVIWHGAGERRGGIALDQDQG
ncbi:MAG TPA: AMP-binding protein, partial [Polyangiaceae bacterium]